MSLIPPSVPTASPAAAPESLSVYNARSAGNLVDRLNSVSGRLSDALYRARGAGPESGGSADNTKAAEGSLFVTREYLQEADEVITEIHAKIDALESLI